MAEVADLQVIDADNIGRFPEGQLLPTLNNGARALEAMLARYIKDINGSLVSTGTAPAYAVATYETFTAHTVGIELKFRAHATFESGAPTLTINGLSAKSLVRNGGFALQPLDVVENQLMHIIYNDELEAYECLGIASKPAEIGDTSDWFFSTLPNSMWLWLNGQTIGNASSGATARASDSAGTKLVFSKLWASLDNTVAPIQTSGGSPTTRGSTAAEDWAAGKRFPLPDTCGRGTVGADNMGGIASKNRLTGLSGGVDADVLGAAGGSESHALSEAQLPVIDVDDYMTDPGHDHNNPGSFSPSGTVASGPFPLSGSRAAENTDPAATGITFSPFGSGAAHNNVQPAIVCNKIIFAGVA